MKFKTLENSFFMFDYIYQYKESEFFDSTVDNIYILDIYMFVQDGQYIYCCSLSYSLDQDNEFRKPYYIRLPKSTYDPSELKKIEGWVYGKTNLDLRRKDIIDMIIEKHKDTTKPIDLKQILENCTK
jgi:hypothetical protein